MKKKKMVPTNENIKKDKITKNDNFDFKDIVIHLDISECESDETQDWSKNEPISVINEFLLSFLITKFYIYNEDIIYIPSNIKIYIEIPNGFSNYLKKIGILNIFPIKNIVLGELK